MTTGDVKRKLTAIFSADVVGYSRLMREDELATVQTLTSHKETMRKLITHYRGRVVDSIGDNLMAEFASVVDAVQCAVEVQQVLSLKNEELPENRKMFFRIGINLGDVIEEGDRIYGDGVNIAARVESLAEGGGVCISGSAFEQIENKLALGYQYMGEHTVKNIAKPVKVYRVPMGPVTEKEKKIAIRVWHKVAVGVVAILIIGFGLWALWNHYWRPSRPPIEVASVEKMAYPLPDKPSIAVLPFVNMSGDPEQEYLSDGLTEQIITSLSMVPRLFVIARNSTFTYKGKAVKMQQVAEELGVGYVLEGSVQKSGEKLRISTQLVDALTGRNIWTGRYDRDLKDLFALYDEIIVKIMSAISVKLTVGERARLGAKDTDNLEAYINVMQGNEYLHRRTKEGNIQARKFAEKAIALDPKFPRAYFLLGRTRVMDVLSGLSKSPRKSLQEAAKLFQKALSLDETEARAAASLGYVYAMQRQHEKSLVQAERAVAINPNIAHANGILGGALFRVGRYEESIQSIEKAIRLDPKGPGERFIFLGESYCFAGQYKEAIAAAKKGVERAPNSALLRVALVAIYNMAGLEEEARAEAEEVLRLNPKFSLEHYGKVMPWRKAELEPWIAALRKAGLPETPSLPLPDKPSIAVLPFDNMSDDPKQEYFSDGISTEIINALVRWPAIVVIPKSSSFIYKGKTVDAKQVGREMGVRYVLEGTVRREGNRVRVFVQLIDVNTLKHLFSERYEREMKDIFAIQDEITIKALTAMRVSLSGEGVQPLRGKGTKNIEAYLKVLQAETVMQAVNRDTQAQARLLAEEAIALDPEYARAYTLKAVMIGNEVLLGVYEDPQEALKRAMAIAEKAVQLDDSEEMAHRGLGFLALLNKDYEKAIAGAKRAVELAPNSVMAQIILGYFLYSAGRTEEAIPILEKAASSSPIILPRALSHLGIALRKAGRLEEAVAVCTRLIQIKPNYIFPHLTLAAAFAEMGKMEEARAEVKEVLRIRPKYTVKLVPSSFPWKDQDELDRLADSLRKAGLPE